MQSTNLNFQPKDKELNSALKEIQELKEILRKMNMAVEVQGENINLITTSIANVQQQVQCTNNTLHNKEIAETHCQRIQYLLTIVSPYINPLIGIGWLLATTSTKTLQNIPNMVWSTASICKYYFNKSYY